MKRSRLRSPDHVRHARWRYSFFSLLAAVLLCSADTRALTEEHWQFRQPFTVEQAGILKFALPDAAVSNAQADLRDLRVVGPAGEEIPFAIIRPFSAPERWHGIERFKTALKDETTVVTIDAGTEKPWDAIEVVTTAPRFLKAVHVEVSKDGDQWESLDRDVPLFRQDGVARTVLPLPETPARWLRLSIDDRRQPPVTVTGIRLREPKAAEAQLSPAAARIVSVEEHAGQTTVSLELASAHLDLEALELTTRDPLFTRKVAVQVRAYREGEVTLETIAEDSIYRLQVGETVFEKTRVHILNTVVGREVVLSIHNGDSPPLRVDAVRGQHRSVQVALHAKTPGAYTLWFGNPQANAPRYDLAQMVDSLRRTPLVTLKHGEVSSIPQYQQPDLLAGLPLEGSSVETGDWRNRRDVHLTASGVQLLELDLPALATAERNLADVRVVSSTKQIPFLVERPGLSRTVDLRTTSDLDKSRPNVSRWRVDLPTEDAPVDRLILSTTAPLFERSVTVLERRALGNGETRLSPVAHATWRKTPDERAATLTIPVRGAVGSALWIEMDNGENAPIELSRVRAAYPVVRLLFRAEKDKPVALLTGNDQARLPRYDLSLVAPALLASAKHPATLAEAVEIEGRGRTGLPIQSWLFWAALAVVVMVLLAVVAKMLPKPPENT